MDKSIETVEMDDQEIPRNLKFDFCDNPTVSPIEFSRNSSLIDNKTRALNISFEKLVEEEENCMNLYPSLNQFVPPDNEKLDCKFISQIDGENSFNLEEDEFIHDQEFSFDDTEFNSYSRSIFENKKDFKQDIFVNIRPKYSKLDCKFISEADDRNMLNLHQGEFVHNQDFSFDDTVFNSYSESMPFFIENKKNFEQENFFHESVELMDGKNLDLGSWTPNKTASNSFLLKEQKSIYIQAKKRRNQEQSKIHLNKSPSFHMTDNEETNEHDLLFDSFSINEGIVLSPIAHEMSQINGRELRDVSNFFSCDISQI